jgi:hypothetical protein
MGILLFIRCVQVTALLLLRRSTAERAEECFELSPFARVELERLQLGIPAGASRAAV